MEHLISGTPVSGTPHSEEELEGIIVEGIFVIDVAAAFVLATAPSTDLG